MQATCILNAFPYFLQCIPCRSTKVMDHSPLNKHKINISHPEWLMTNTEQNAHQRPGVLCWEWLPLHYIVVIWAKIIHCINPGRMAKQVYDNLYAEQVKVKFHRNRRFPLMESRLASLQGSFPFFLLHLQISLDNIVMETRRIVLVYSWLKSAGREVPCIVDNKEEEREWTNYSRSYKEWGSAKIKKSWKMSKIRKWFLISIIGTSNIRK